MRLHLCLFHVERLDMTALVQENLQSIAHQLEIQQIRVSVSELPTVCADRTAMEQIVGNLLDNAVKYLYPNLPGIIQVLGEQLEAETLFRVVDNGRGIPAERCDAIFEVFGRAGIEDVPGEGMGLAYVQSLVRRLGGRIWCDSELGRGSRFSVAIPTSMNKRGLPPFIT